MLRGYLDELTSSGYFVGWAYDVEAPASALPISILDDQGQEVAHGLAHRYRDDLVAAGCGIGWCAFRLRATVSVSQLKKTAVSLVEAASGEIIVHVDPVPYHDDADPPIATMAELTAFDPTCLNSVDQLNGCEDLLNDFVKARGVDAFVRMAYVYILGRPADAEGLTLYGRLIRQAFLSPYVLLRTLADSGEFRSRPRFLCAPNMAGFPFRCD